MAILHINICYFFPYKNISKLLLEEFTTLPFQSGPFGIQYLWNSWSLCGAEAYGKFLQKGGKAGSISSNFALQPFIAYVSLCGYIYTK